jgi:hypothetical protein
MFHENLFSWGAYYAPDTLTDPFAPSLKQFNKKRPHKAKGFPRAKPCGAIVTILLC